MHLGGLDLNLLIALDALLSEQNVTRAAERINISQPGMSAALQKLRYYFSDPLLERVGRRLELTPRASALASPVKQILFDIGSLTSSFEQFDPATARRTFRIGASTYCGDLLAAPAIRRLEERAPNISCQFDDLHIDTLHRLVEGQLDFVITVAHRLFGDGSDQTDILSELPLFKDELVLVAGVNNTLVGADVSFDELCELPYAEVRFSHDLMGVGERVWLQQSKSPRVRTWLPNYHLTLEVVSRTDTVAMVPARLVAAYDQRFGLRTLPLPLEVPVLEERILWHPRNETDPGHLWFRNLLSAIVDEQGLAAEAADLS